MNRSGLRGGVDLVALTTMLVSALSRPPISNAETINQSLYVTNGSVTASALSGAGTLYIGGNFTTVGPASGCAVPVDATTGALMTPYDKVAGIVFASVPDGSGGWYIGGAFVAVAGVPRNNLAHLLSGNTLDLSWNPNVNGTVSALALSGSTVYAGGSFTTVNGSTSRIRLAAFDASTGIATAWDPQASNAINAIVVSGSTVYVGGSFGTVNGTTQRNRIAALDASTGVATSWNPNASNTVSAIAVSGSTVYVGGTFTTMNGSTTRNRIAALDASTGTATSWDPNANGTVNAIAVSGSTVYVGGAFTSVNGSTTRNRIAALDAFTGTATSWDPNANGTVTAIAMNGSTVYVGGTFNTVNGSTSRNQGAAIDAGSGVATAWNPNFNAVVRCLVVSGSTVYAGGSFTSLNAQSRPNLAELDLTTGQVTSWNPNVNGQVLALVVDGAVVYAGGSFTTANGGTPRNRIASFAASNGAATAWDPNANSQVNALAINGSTVYAAGLFTTIGGQSRNHIAALDASTGLATSWRPSLSGGANAMALSGGVVYVGGQFNSASQSARGFAAFDASSAAGQLAWPEANNNVYAMAPDGSGGWYVGGFFTQVGGTARNYLAHVLADMSVDGSWAPEPNGTVTQLAVNGATVYVAGYFSSIGGQSRNYIAALDAATGLATSWNPNPNNPVSAVAVSGSTVYVGGNFGTIGGQSRVGIAAIDATTGLATGWNPSLGGLSPTVTALAVDGTTVYAAGAFTFVGFTSRIKLAAIDAASGLATSWNPGADGDIITMVLDNSTLYVGGFFTTIAGVSRSRIGAISTITGAATAWDPNSNAGVHSIAVSGSTVYAGGDFFGPGAAIGGQPRTGIAALDATTGLATSWDPKLDATDVSVVAVNGATVFTGGAFSAVGFQTRNRAVALDATTGAATAWNPNSSGPVSALAVNGSTVYAGGNFTVIGGQNRGSIAALDAATGSAMGWNPNANGPVSALAVTATTVYVGGSFFNIGGQARAQLAALDPSTGTALPWNPSPNSSVSSLTRGATTLFAGGGFTAVGKSPQAGIAAIEDDLPPSLLAVTPASGGNSGSVTVTITGQRMWSGASVQLVRSGQANILGTGVMVAADSLSLTASFDLAGKPVGAWNVVVTNPDLQSATLINGFAIGTLAAPQLRVSIVGQSSIRAGYPEAFDLIVENPGNVDAVAVPLWVTGIPAGVTVTPDFVLSPPLQEGGEPSWSGVPPTFAAGSGQFLPLVIPLVPPGTMRRRIILDAPSSVPLVQLGAAVAPPWSGVTFAGCLNSGGVVADPACTASRLASINSYLAANPQLEAVSGTGIWAKEAWQCEGASDLGTAIAKSEQVLDYLDLPIEQGSAPTGCGDALLAQWRQVLQIQVVFSIDPNDKLSPQGTIAATQAIPYSIRFENLNTATASARQVTVVDPLPTNLDLSTLSLESIDLFGTVHLIPPPGSRQFSHDVDLGHDNLIVRITATLDLPTRQLTWIFTTLDKTTLQPPSNPLFGFLPPNVPPPQGEGSVLFTIRTAAGTVNGATIQNGATLNFDGAAQNTPVVSNLLDTNAPASNVLSLNTPISTTSFPVSWQSTGSPTDLRDFTIYVAEDGQPYQAWKTNTTTTADTYVPRPGGHSYAFYSVARDVSGNIEAAPTSPDAQTLSTTGVEPGQAWALALGGARPNPARGTIHVWFTLPSHERATLELIDVAGRRMTRREVGTMGPGQHFLNLDASPRLKAGIYFLRLIQGERVLRSRVALVR